jgi:hypothetical protein
MSKINGQILPADLDDLPCPKPSMTHPVPDVKESAWPRLGNNLWHQLRRDRSVPRGWDGLRLQSAALAF